MLATTFFRYFVYREGRGTFSTAVALARPRAAAGGSRRKTKPTRARAPVARWKVYGSIIVYNMYTYRSHAHPPRVSHTRGLAPTA